MKHKILTERVTLRLPVELHKQIKKKAKSSKEGEGELMRAILQGHFAELEDLL